ncbi:hypothetical protein MTP99_007502 [Tenebrio molitor]|nr:hypothetical protein MTP99_007502 [Tenebrio molitor]
MVTSRPCLRPSPKPCPKKEDDHHTTCQAGSYTLPAGSHRHRGCDLRRTQPDYSGRTFSGSDPRLRRPVTKTKTPETKQDKENTKSYLPR